MNVTIDPKLKTKCPRTALGCLTAQVAAGASPDALLQGMKAREMGIQKLPFPRGVLEAPQIVAARAAYKALGKDPARYRGSAEALFRRGGAGEGRPRDKALVGLINIGLVGRRAANGVGKHAPVDRGSYSSAGQRAGTDNHG